MVREMNDRILVYRMLPISTYIYIYASYVIGKGRYVSTSWSHDKVELGRQVVLLSAERV